MTDIEEILTPAKVGYALGQVAASAMLKSPTALPIAVRMYRSIDDAITAEVKKKNLPTACRAGCSYCCYYRVVASPLEIIAISEHIKGTWSQQRQEWIGQRIADHRMATSHLTPEQHTRSNIQCPFLEDNRCSIYAIRPIACRTHHEVRSVDPCIVTWHTPTTPAVGYTHAAIKAVGEGAQLGLLYRFRDARSDLHSYELIAGLDDAMTNAAVRRRFSKGAITFTTAKDRFLPDFNESKWLLERISGGKK